MKTKIVVDSSSSLYALPGVDFACVPLKIVTDEQEYLDDGTLDPRCGLRRRVCPAPVRRSPADGALS